MVRKLRGSKEPGGPRLQLLGGLTPDEFLTQYWQKRPLLVRGALKNFRDPVTPDDLAALACQPEVESRIIRSPKGRRNWSLERGPFEDEVLENLPSSGWTLLVQEAHRHVPALSELLDAFAFIPNFRLDDVMVSCAPSGGTVGPHVDSYDVFLIQGRGAKRWQLTGDLGDNPKLIPGIDIRILETFEAECDWTLETGDLLYLPPGVGHFGVASGMCLTYSVGFLAVTGLQVLSEVVRRKSESGLCGSLYSDPDLVRSAHPGEIPSVAFERVRALVRDCTISDEEIDRSFSQVVSRLGPLSGLRGRARPMTGSQVLQQWLGDRLVERSEDCRFVYREAGRNRLFFYFDGRELELRDAAAKMARWVSNRRRFRRSEVSATWRDDEDATRLLGTLANAGAIRFRSK